MPRGMRGRRRALFAVLALAVSLVLSVAAGATLAVTDLDAGSLGAGVEVMWMALASA